MFEGQESLFSTISNGDGFSLRSFLALELRYRTVFAGSQEMLLCMKCVFRGMSSSLRETTQGEEVSSATPSRLREGFRASKRR